MKTIAYFSNFLNHHQKLLADQLFFTEGISFTFVETVPMYNWLKKGGYSDYSNLQYVLRAWENEDVWQRAVELAISADIALFGGPEVLSLLYVRAQSSDKLSFEVSERWLKKGFLNLFSPSLIKNMWYYHTLFGRKPVYKLCASAYAAGDQYKLFSYKDRCYKWGYFTKVDDYNVEGCLDTAQPCTMKIMWCARFLKCKHPELPIRLAARLKNKGYDFVIDMYGSGDRLEKIRRLASRLDVLDVVNFCGNKPNAEILQEMSKHDIFLFTSDRNEGWGAVLNEAMSCRCAVVASDKIGAVPYLINDGVNGMIFKSENLDSLEEKVVFLFNHPSEMCSMANNAYNTLKTVWSPASAAKNLLQLIDDLTNGNDTSLVDGPCSKALPI